MKSCLLTFLAVLAAIIVAAVGYGLITAHSENVVRARKAQREEEAAKRLQEMREQDARDDATPGTSSSR